MIFRTIQEASVLQPHPWNGDTRSSIDSQNKVRWIKHQYGDDSSNPPWRFTEEDGQHKVCPTQSHGWAEATETHFMPRLHPDLSRQSQFSWLHCNLGWGHGYFNMTQRRNVRACNGPKSHHQGPRSFVCKSPRTKPCWSHFLTNKHGVIHTEFVPEGQRVNSVFCVEVIGRLLKHIFQVRPQFRADGSWFLLHDNAPSHSTPAVKIFRAKHGVVEVSHPPFSRSLTRGFFSSLLRWKLPSKKEVSGCWGH
jgi:hypothetical protein